MTRSNVRRAALIAAAVFGAGAVAASCSTTSSHHDDVGSVAVALTLSPGVTVNTVTFQITGNGITPINGTIDVTNATRATALVPGLPAGSGYQVTMDATSTDGMTTCHGVGTFSVVAGQTASATVTLQCRGQGNGTGTVAINGRLDNCPFITSFMASSLQGVVGGAPISISVAATDFDAMDTITYAWTTSAPGVGSLGNPAAASTTFTCDTAGTTQLSIAVSDGVCGDNRMPAIPVECVIIGGVGGRMGTGGMGVGGAGTGGAGTGGAGTGGAMMAENTCTLSPPQEPTSGTMACGGCQTDNCSFGPAGTDGCCVFSDPMDQLLCIRAANCFARNTTACTTSGDPTRCFCGTSASACFATPGAANGLCVPEVNAAAKSTDPTVVRAQFNSPASPLGRAVNLTGCRGSFCSAECAIN